MPDPRTRRSQQQRREHTEAALLTAAAEIVVESGVRALTIAAIGARAGYSRGIVTHHFGSKQGLVDALARDSQRGLVPEVGGMPAGLDRLLVLLDGYVAALSGHGPNPRVFLLLWVEAATDPQLTAVFRARDRWFRAEIAADIDAGLAAGTVRGDVSASAVAVGVVAQLRGIALQWLVDPESVDVARLRTDVPGWWGRCLGPEPPPGSLTTATGRAVDGAR